MKKFLTLFAMLTLFVSMMAQTTFNYQAVLRDTANNNELLRNQSGTAHIFVKVNADAVDLYVGEFMSNNDGMVNLQLSSEGINWMYVDTIYAVFTFGENTIELNTAVTAVPYACQAGTAILTTEDIQEYLGSGVVGGNDVNRIYQALQSNSDMHDAARDTIVKYIKENKDLAMKIGYHYLSQLTAADVNEAYNQALGLNQEVRDSIYSVVKSFLKDNHAMLTDLAKYYAQNATADEVNQLYQELLANESASAKVKSLLNSYFAHYLTTKGLNNCNGLTLCDMIGSLDNNTNNTTTDDEDCPAWTSSTFGPTLDNGYYTATLTFTGNTTHTTVSGTYTFTEAGSAPGNETAIPSEAISVNGYTVTLNLLASSLPQLANTGDQIIFKIKLSNSNSDCTAQPVCTGTYEQGQFPTVDPCAIANDFNATATISNGGLVAELSCTGDFDWTNRGFSATAYDANNGSKNMNAQVGYATCNQDANINAGDLGNFVPKTVVFEVYGTGENCEATTFTANVEGCPSFGESHVRYHENQIIYVIPFDPRLYSDVFSANSFTITIHQSGQSDITATIIGNPVSYSPTTTDHYVELTTDIVGTIEYSSASYTIDINVPNCSVQSVSGNYSELCPSFGTTTLCKNMNDDATVETEHSVTIRTPIENYDPSIGTVRYDITFYVSEGTSTPGPRYKSFNVTEIADGYCTLTVTKSDWLGGTQSVPMNPTTTWNVTPVLNYTNTSLCGASEVSGTSSGTVQYQNIPACNN